MYTESDKTLVKLKNTHTRNGKGPCSWSERLDIVKMTTLSRVIYSINTSLSKYNTIFAETSKAILEVI